MLLGIWAITSGCATGLPPGPEGEIYRIHIPSQTLLCSDLKTGNSCPAIDLQASNKFYAMPTETWKNLNNYIDELIRRLSVKNFSGNDSTVSLTAQNLRDFKGHMKKIHDTLYPIH